MTSELLDALAGVVDEGTIIFLLDTLASFQEEDCDFDEEVVPLVESLIENFSAAEGVLKILKSDTEAVSKAKTALEDRRQEEEDCYNEIDGNHPQTPPRLSQNNTRYTPIEGAENRAITLTQLLEVYEYVESQAEADGSLPWFDRNEASPTNGQRLYVRTINLYQLVEAVIKPFTKTNRCSMVEILNTTTGPQKPKWFVSHAWAEPIHDFVQALREHAKVRALDDGTTYWICAYSNNQHHIEEDIQSNPKETSFYKALQASEGMLLCLDSAGTPFSRMWCMFEQSRYVEETDGLGSRNRRLLLDIATVGNIDGKAVVITDGRAAVAADLKDGAKFCLEFKRDRERGFPLELLERGYEIDIREAQATRDEDRRSILNAIANINNDPYHEPNLRDPCFQRINKVLRGVFAESAAAKAAQSGRLDAVVRVLHEDSDRTVLTLNLGGSEYLDLSALESLRHPSLRQLTIDCSYSSIPNVTGIAQCIAGLQCLEELVLSFDWCRTLSDVSQLSEKGFSSLEALRVVRLDFKGCAFPVFLPRIEEAQSLQKVFIDCSNTPSRANGKLLQGVLQLKNLQELDLLFNSCRHVNHLNVFKKIDQLSELKRISLDFSYTRLNDANELGTLVNIQHLQHCKLSFTKCTQMTSIPWLNDLAFHGTELELDLSECKGLDSAIQTHFRCRRALLKTLAGNSNRVFEVGEEVQYLSKLKKAWLPAVVTMVGPGEVEVKVSYQNCPRKIISSDDIPARIRKHSQRVNGMSPEITSYDDDEGDPNCLLSKFRVGESVEYFARDWKKRWLPGTVTKVESEAIKIKVPGYNELRRVTASEITLKVRRPNKKG